MTDVVLVSVHVRRTDYHLWMAGNVAGKVVSGTYFHTAMNVFRQRYNSNEGNGNASATVHANNVVRNKKVFIVR
jgi:hypothetical protein